MNITIMTLRQLGAVREIDVQLLDMIQRRYNDGRPLPDTLQLALALASQAVHRAHVCLDLNAVDEAWILGEGATPMKNGQDARATSANDDMAARGADNTPRAELAALCEAVRQETVRRSWLTDYGRIVAGPAQPDTPFVLDGSLLYLRRYFNYEKQVANRLSAMAKGAAEALDARQKAKIHELLPDNEGARQAAEKALTRKLCVISGGPGTGKTFTAARILYLLDATNPGPGERLHVKVAAPTGKAAARVAESLIAADKQLEPFRRSVIDPACTLERLLGYRHGSPYFKHHAGNPLPADVVLIDEASMIDLPKMAKLLDALREDARLILLGDMHQLASVAPGSVMGDMCQSSALRDCIVELKESWRFRVNTPVAQLSDAVNTARNEQDAEAVWHLLETLSASAPVEGSAHVSLHALQDETRLIDGKGMIDSSFAAAILKGYSAFLGAQSPKEAFRALSQFRVLCAMRHGPFGVETVNRLIEKVLAQESIDKAKLAAVLPPHKLKPVGAHYKHQVVMVTRNDYGLKLFNGDVGVVLPAESDQDQLAVYFEPESGNRDAPLRQVSWRRLPEHETAYAMSVHKSQGSEFEDVLLLLPNRMNPVMTRELVYTGITRVSRHIEIWAKKETFTQTVQKSVKRFSGLVIE